MAASPYFLSLVLPYPIYAQAWIAVFPLLDADGDPVLTAAGLDSIISKDGDAPIACVNEATEITGTGLYWLLLTAAEMTANQVMILVRTSTSGAKYTPLSLYPRKLVQVLTGAPAGGSTSTIALPPAALATDDVYNGMVIALTSPGGVDLRLVADYVGATRTATIAGQNWWWAVPTGAHTFAIYQPEGVSHVTVGALALQAQADVRGQVAAALTADLYPEPGQEAPPTSASIATKLGYLYKFLRNKITQSTTQLSVYNAAGTVVDHKAPVSDDGLYTRDQIGSGP